MGEQLKPYQKRSNVIAFNGDYYTKNGEFRNLDGGPGGVNKSKLQPIPGIFIGSDNKEHDISELFSRNGNSGGTINKYVYKFEITDPGSGYTQWDQVNFTFEGFEVSFQLSEVDSNGGFLGFGNQFPSIISHASALPDQNFYIISEYEFAETPIQGVTLYEQDSDSVKTAPMIKMTKITDFSSVNLSGSYNYYDYKLFLKDNHVYQIFSISMTAPVTTD